MEKPFCKMTLKDLVDYLAAHPECIRSDVDHLARHLPQIQTTRVPLHPAKIDGDNQSIAVLRGGIQPLCHN